jgi:ribosomal protein L13E
MRFLARCVERALNVAVQRLHDADARKHRWAAERRHRSSVAAFGLTFAELRSLGIDEIAAQTQGRPLDFRRVSAVPSNVSY